MRTFSLAAHIALVLLNCFPGYSGQALALEMRQVAVHDGIRLSNLSEAAFALQPCCYLLAAAALVVSVLGKR